MSPAEKKHQPSHKWEVFAVAAIQRLICFVLDCWNRAHYVQNILGDDSHKQAFCLFDKNFDMKLTQAMFAEVHKAAIRLVHNNHEETGHQLCYTTYHEYLLSW